MLGVSRRYGGLARIPLTATAGLLTGLGLGLVICVVVTTSHSPPDLPISSSSGPSPMQADAPPVFWAAPPAKLVGLKGSVVRRTFGEPEMRRREPPAEVWQYRTPGCVLDLYFYGDPEGEGVVHFESRPRDPRQGSAMLPNGCIGELAARRRPLI
jgi:hypothetical protein